jgi:hypothetical protein
MEHVAQAELEVPQRHGDWSLLHFALVSGTITLLLLLPAIYNRFPMVFPDTSSYLSVAYASRWPIDRAGFYGLFLAPALVSFEPVAGLWLAIGLQGATIALVLVAAARRLLPGDRPLAIFALVASATILTSLPWHASQLMPDAFSGALVLLVWLAASQNLSVPGTALFWLATAALALMHQTHVTIVATGAAVTFLVAALTGTSRTDLAKRVLAAVLTIAAIVGSHTAVNGLAFGRWQASPLGGYFLFARLNEDGLIPRWMDRHCGRDAPKALCDLRSSLPQDSQVLLWGDKGRSPLNDRINQNLGNPEHWVWVDMVSAAARETMREEPLAFATNAFYATIRQLTRFQAPDDRCPEDCREMVMLKWQPSFADPLRNSRQLKDDLPEREIRLITSAVATVGLLLLLPLMIIAYRRRDTLALTLLLTIAVALLVNAATAGALSNVRDRYQSRIVWLAPFAAALLIRRWKAREIVSGATVWS